MNPAPQPTESNQEGESEPVFLESMYEAVPVASALSSNRYFAKLILASFWGEQEEFTKQALASLSLIDVPYDPDRPEFSDKIFENYERILDTTFPKLHFLRPKPKELRMVESSKLNSLYFEERFKYKLGKSDRVVLSDWFRCTLHAGDLDKLEPMKWINDAIANFFIELFKSKEYLAGCKLAHPFSMTSEQFLLFNTYFSSYIECIEKPILEAGSQAEQLEQVLSDLATNKISWLVSRKRADITQFSLILIPYFRKFHWNLYVVQGFDELWTSASSFLSTPGAEAGMLGSHLSQTAITCYSLDSLYSSTSEHRVNFLTLRYALQTTLVGILNNTFSLKLPYSTPLLSDLNFRTVVLRSISQRNAVDCGPALLENIEQIIQKGMKFLLNPEIELNESIKQNTFYLQQKRVLLISIILELEKGKSVQNVIEDYIQRTLSTIAK